MNFFKNNKIKERDVQITNENKINLRENEKNISNMKSLKLFDVDTIQYIINNFPSMSINIQEGLKSLIDILENTVDYIEDKSSELIKENRDFNLSEEHREVSIAIYNVAKNIDEYIKWMQDEYEKNMKINDNSQNEETKSNIIEEKHIEENEEELSISLVNDKEIEIYNDFSLKEPKSFRLDDNVVMVEDWNDLLVKTAEILTKKYKKNKYSNKKVKEITPIQKKSSQNSFRDTAIEMLTEYKISLDKFKIMTR